MKVVFLAGGFGSRLSEETIFKPKPMVEIGGMPILWHLMKIYSTFGFNEFIICMGYKKDVIIEYFLNNYSHQKYISVKGHPKELVFENKVDNWKISLVDTGETTMTGGRLKRIEKIVENQTFLLSYGDTLSNVNIQLALKTHKRRKSIVTLTSIQPRSNYGVVLFDSDHKTVKKFVEKPLEKNTWINGGFYAFEPEIFKYLKDDSTVLELDPLQKIARRRKLSAYKHRGFWKSMETYKDKLELENLWENNEAKWNIWEQRLGKVL